MVVEVASTRAACWKAEDVLAEGGTEDEAYHAAVETASRVRRRFAVRMGVRW